jgi:hypothetical protein
MQNSNDVFLKCDFIVPIGEGNMCIYRPKLSNYLFILIVLISAVSNASNFYERHGNNFIYLDNLSASQYDTLLRKLRLGFVRKL